MHVLRVPSVEQPPEITPAIHGSPVDLVTKMRVRSHHHTCDTVDSVAFTDVVIADVVNEGDCHRPYDAGDESGVDDLGVPPTQLCDPDQVEREQRGEEALREGEASVPLAPDRVHEEQRERCSE